MTDGTFLALLVCGLLALNCERLARAEDSQDTTGAVHTGPSATPVGGVEEAGPSPERRAGWPPFPARARGTAIETARLLTCESGASERDAIAIMHIAERRGGLRFLRRYSTCRLEATPWARSIMHVAPRRLRYVELVTRWDESEHVDPCGGLSRGWAHPRLVARARRLDCGGTANAFVR